MNFPPPSAKQARILWLSLTSLAVGILLALGALLLWGIGWVLNGLSAVLLPLAVAAILTYLLDPVVDFLDRHRVQRSWAILLVFVLAVGLFLVLIASIIPVLVVEVGDLVRNLPRYAADLQTTLSEWLATSRLGKQAREVWTAQFAERAQAWFNAALPVLSAWALAQMSRVASWAGLLVGLALVPIYVFYFLQEKYSIARSWTDYLPVRESRVKEEVVFVLRAINDYLILFFRGQILVALCDGVLLTVGFLLVGLNYAFLFGIAAGLLSIVPYLGITISIIPTVILAAVQYRDWLHPVLVLVVFGVAQTLEAWVISPKIMGDRVGLHPVTIIIAVMVGTALLGGILGGVLAIPLTAALRVLMYRYVWRTRQRQAAPVSA